MNSQSAFSDRNDPLPIGPGSVDTMKNLLFWVVFPFLIPQALYVRRTAPRFAPAGGPAEGEVGVGEEVRLLAIGDSIVAGVGASTLSAALVGQTAAALARSRNCRVSWRAIGVSGYNSSRLLARVVPQLPDVAFDYIIVSVGVNDVTGLTSVRRWRRNLALLLARLRAFRPMPGSLSREYRRCTASRCCLSRCALSSG